MTSRRTQFKNSRNYVLYYGRGKEEYLRKYDIAVVEPQGQSRESLELMHDAGTLVIAYVSIMEVSKDSSMFSLLKDEDFLCLDGEPVVNDEYRTYLIDLRSKKWGKILMQHIGNLIINENYDGIFIDTLCDIEWCIFSEHIKSELLFSSRMLLNNIRSLFDDIIIIQNNGLHEVINYTWDLVDGLCLENPRFPIGKQPAWVYDSIEKIKKLSEHENIKMLILYEEKHFNKLYFNFIEEKFLFYKTNSYTIL